MRLYHQILYRLHGIAIRHKEQALLSLFSSWSGQHTRLTPHLCLVPLLRMHRIYLNSLYAASRDSSYLQEHLDFMCKNKVASVLKHHGTFTHREHGFRFWLLCTTLLNGVQWSVSLSGYFVFRTVTYSKPVYRTSNSPFPRLCLNVTVLKKILYWARTRTLVI
jgi:hypothetical protein